MAEVVQETVGTGHVAQTRLPAGQAGTTGFEPEVLAFCCEH
jgi:hypothetical protein